MFSVEDIRKKREEYERKIEDILMQFVKELPPGIKIEDVVATRAMGSGENSLKCRIKLVVEDLNK